MVSLSAIKQSILRKSKKIKRSIARFSRKKSQRSKNHLPKSVTTANLKGIQEEEDFSFLTADILQQLRNPKRRSRKSLHNKKSLKSVIEEARRELRRDTRPNTEIRIISIEEDNCGKCEDYVDYEDIVVTTYRPGDINSDYLEMV